tara:strand:- start:283 stop:630 length:348 start_codon:yes stop_codon:yes gene_type:complete
MEQETDLSNKKCVPCEGGVDALTKDQASNLMIKLDKNWVLANNNKSISKDFKFKNHYEVISAINLIAWISHKEDHHPEITYGYSNLSVKFFTYAIDGLSENDFICAAKIDKVMKC